MFNKDIVLVDLEATGLDVSKHEIIQLAAVLLDKKTLRIKSKYSSFVKPLRWKNRDPEAMKVNRIAYDSVKSAPALKLVLKEFVSKFPPSKVIFAYYGGPVDPDFMRAGFKKSGMQFSYDYHFFNIWGLFYTFFALKGKLTNRKRFSGFSLEDAMDYFKIKSDSRHDALEDAIIEAKILENIVKKLKA